MKCRLYLLTLLLVCTAAVAKNKVKKNVEVDPRQMGYDYYMSQPFTPDETWTFNNKYDFYPIDQKAKKTRVVHHLDGISANERELFAQEFLRVCDPVTLQDSLAMAELTDEDTYVFDFNLALPAFLYLNIDELKIYVEPGDTLEVFTTTMQKSGPTKLYNVRQESAYYGFRSNSESGLINALLPALEDKIYPLRTRKETIDFETKLSATTNDSLLLLLGEMEHALDEMMTGERARNLLIHSPLSDSGKNLVMLSAAARLAVDYDKVASYHIQRANKRVRNESGSWQIVPDTTWKDFPKNELYAPLLRYKTHLFNSHLFLSLRNVEQYITDFRNGSLFERNSIVQKEKGEGRIESDDPLGLHQTLVCELLSSHQIGSFAIGMKDKIAMGENAASQIDRLREIIAGEMQYLGQKYMVTMYVLDLYRDAIMKYEVGSGLNSVTNTNGQFAKQNAETAIWTCNGHEAVDLALPSGTKWATMNIGAQKPEDFGDYIAWGESSGKDVYYLENYLQEFHSKMKYEIQMATSADPMKDFAFPTGKDIAGTRFDAATQRWGEGWTMPTVAQFRELFNHTTQHEIKKNGVTGILYTSKKNGNSVFFPYAGSKHENKLWYNGERANYWSSSSPVVNRVAVPHTAICFFPDDSMFEYRDFLRTQGCSVRAVTR